MFKFIDRYSKKKELTKEMQTVLDQHSAARKFLSIISKREFQDHVKEFTEADEREFSEAYRTTFRFVLDCMDETMERAFSIDKELSNL